MTQALQAQGKSTEERSVISVPSFDAFNSTTELWGDYWSRFKTFAKAHSIPESKVAQIFLSYQSPVTYKLLENLASQRQSPTDIDNLTLEEIAEFMGDQFNPKRFVVRERFNYWSSMDRKPGETVQELAARIRQDAVTCNFPDIDDPLDEALRTRFICSVKNEAVLKSLFKLKDDELTFAKAIQVAMETEDAAKVAKATVTGTNDEYGSSAVHRIPPSKKAVHPKSRTKVTTYTSQDKKSNGKSSTVACTRCGKTNHKREDCFHKASTCNYCKKTGHIEPACFQKKKAEGPHTAHKIMTVNTLKSTRQPRKSLLILGHSISFEVDTGSAENFITETVWKELGKPRLTQCTSQYESASKHPLPVLGVVHCDVAQLSAPATTVNLKFVVTSIPDFNIIGCDAICQLKVSVDSLLGASSKPSTRVNPISVNTDTDRSLQQTCKSVCEEFPDLFKTGRSWDRWLIWSRR